jgi:hypothetical protein
MEEVWREDVSLVIHDQHFASYFTLWISGGHASAASRYSGFDCQSSALEEPRAWSAFARIFALLVANKSDLVDSLLNIDWTLLQERL